MYVKWHGVLCSYIIVVCKGESALLNNFVCIICKQMQLMFRCSNCNIADSIFYASSILNQIVVSLCHGKIHVSLS